MLTDEGGSFTLHWLDWYLQILLAISSHLQGTGKATWMCRSDFDGKQVTGQS